MQKGRGGMGSRKHGVSGRSGKGPATRLYLDMMARKDERKSKTKPLRFAGVKKALEKEAGPFSATGRLERGRRRSRDCRLAHERIRDLEGGTAGAAGQADCREGLHQAVAQEAAAARIISTRRLSDPIRGHSVLGSRSSALRGSGGNFHQPTELVVAQFGNSIPIVKDR